MILDAAGSRDITGLAKGMSPDESSIHGNDSSSFGAVLRESLDAVNRLQVESDQAVQNLATGKVTDIHETMIAMEKASISFEFVVQMRNKIVSAYEEVMRMSF